MISVSVRLLLVLFSLVSITTSLFAQEPPGSYGIELDRLVLETRNPDSVVRAFERDGFDIKYDRSHSTFRVDTVLLNNYTRIEVAERSQVESGDARLDSLGTYYSAVVFRIAQAVALHNMLLKDSITVGPILQFSDKQDDSILTKDAFGIAGNGPLDIVFLRSTLEVPDVDTVDHNRIDWLIVTAGKQVMARLQRAFELLNLTRKHEGCCDYWLIGSPDQRMKIRFDFDVEPSDPEWLSIERLGVIYAR